MGSPGLRVGSVLCKLAAIDDGGAKVCVLGDWREGNEVVIARVGEKVFGYVNVCPHMALPLNIDERVHTSQMLIFCDHHQAAFRFTDGYCVAGVCVGLALTPVALVVRDGHVILA